MRVFRKSLLKNDFHTNDDRVLSISKCKRIMLLSYKNLLSQVLTVLIYLTFKKPCVDIKKSLLILKNVGFIRPSGSILAHSSLIYDSSKRGSIRICRFNGYEWLMMSAHTAR